MHQGWNWRNPRSLGAEWQSGVNTVGRTVGSPRDRHSRGRRRDTTTASPTATILGATILGATILGATILGATILGALGPIGGDPMTTGQGNRSARTGRTVMAGAPTTGQTVGKTMTRAGTRAGAPHRAFAREAIITAGSARH